MDKNDCTEFYSIYSSSIISELEITLPRSRTRYSNLDNIVTIYVVRVSPIGELEMDRTESARRSTSRKKRKNASVMRHYEYTAHTDRRESMRFSDRKGTKVRDRTRLWVPFDVSCLANPGFAQYHRKEAQKRGRYGTRSP